MDQLKSLLGKQASTPASHRHEEVREILLRRKSPLQWRVKTGLDVRGIRDDYDWIWISVSTEHFVDAFRAEEIQLRKG